MSTKSVIAIENPDKTTRSIYCHFDGYVHGGVGEVLFTCYQDEKKITELLDLGSISSLGGEVAPKDGVVHDFDNPCAGVTVAYHRDRGEKLSEPSIYESATELLKKAGKDFWAEYVYLWRDGKWFVGNCYDTDNGFVSVESVL